MRMKKFKECISGKGYYIALGLCAVIIAISGFLYYRNAAGTKPTLQDPSGQVNATLTPGDDIQAVATEPTGSQTPTQPGKPNTPKKPLKTASPVAGTTVAEYAMDCLSYNQTTRDWRTHNGIDIAAETGTAVSAAADGTVYTVYEDETMGMTVVVTHADGYTTSYASLAEEVSVRPGQTVKLGDKIGTVGQTALLECAIGDHVHFSVKCNDKPVNPSTFFNLG